MHKIIVVGIFILFLGSCTNKGPYEIRSPCVSSDTDNPWAHNPCVRKPLNRNIV